MKTLFSLSADFHVAVQEKHESFKSIKSKNLIR